MALTAPATVAQASQETTLKADALTLLFVQDAQGVAFNNGTITLKNAKHQVLYFSDRPHRDDLVFSGIKIIQGTMPASGGPNALFIDTVPGPRGPLDPRGPADPRGPR